jgi:hydrogenase-4 component E
VNFLLALAEGDGAGPPLPPALTATGHAIDVLLILSILSNFVQVGSSRLAVSVRALGAQGIFLGLLPLLLPGHGWAVSSLFLAVASIGLKGLVFPALLFRAMRRADVRHEAEPFVGYSLSMVLGVITLGVCLWLGKRLGDPLPDVPPRVVPTALFTVWVGLFLIVSRKKALTQVMGYLTLENGIYLFGLALAREEPLLVEMGVLLDVFVAVFVMGITIFHISREFDHTDVDQLSRLKG